MSFLIVGATGKQGGAAITALLAAKSSPNNHIDEIRFITRNPASESALSLEKRGAKAYKADLYDAVSLTVALSGVQRAFLVTDSMTGEAKELLQGKTFIDAAKAAGVQHIVFTSSCAADIATTVPHWRGKYEIEKYLKGSGVSFTILRPVQFMDNFPPQGGMARAGIVGLLFAAGGFVPMQFIAVEDIGVFARKALLNPQAPEFKNATLDLSSGVYTLKDVRAAIATAQGGKQPWIMRFPTVTRRLLPYDFRQLMYFFEEQGYPPVNVERLRRIHPGLLSMEDWIRKGTQTA